jgi:hypothetical protein
MSTMALGAEVGLALTYAAIWLLQGSVYAVVGTWVSNQVDLLPLQHTGAAHNALQPSAPDEGIGAALLPLLRLPNGTPRSVLVRHSPVKWRSYTIRHHS